MLTLLGADAVGRSVGGRSLDAQPITLPLRFEGSVPVIVATIDGHRASLIVDVGQVAALTLYPSAADALKPAATGRTLSYTDVQGSVVATPIFEVQHLEFGGIRFQKVDGYVVPGEPTDGSTGQSAQGVIGLGALRDFRVILDYQGKRMTLIPSADGSVDPSDRCRGTIVPFLPNWNGIPVATASTDVGDVVFVWETRAERSVVRSRFAEDANATVTHGSVSTQHLTFGDHDFGALRLATIDYGGSSGTDGFIGNDFLSTHVVCFDFPGRRLLIRP
jgi:hypothetical protein